MLKFNSFSFLELLNSNNLLLYCESFMRIQKIADFECVTLMLTIWVFQKSEIDVLFSINKQKELRINNRTTLLIETTENNIIFKLKEAYTYNNTVCFDDTDFQKSFRADFTVYLSVFTKRNNGFEDAINSPLKIFSCAIVFISIHVNIIVNLFNLSRLPVKHVY